MSRLHLRHSSVKAVLTALSFTGSADVTTDVTAVPEARTRPADLASRLNVHTAPHHLAVLRSKSPAVITQEIWGHLCCHYAIRTLMFDAAEHAGTSQSESRSSPRCASHADRSPNRALFPPETPDTVGRLWRYAIGELIGQLLPRRLPRANPG